jgi:EPS-associated MarR family transcriptional regulator
VNEETTYKLFKLIEANPELSQRDLAKNMNVSLGKVNYCLRALKEKGLVKVKNFKNNPNKKGYIYVLTPKGVNERMRVTARFLKNKLNEYEKLKKEIEQLQQEAD